MNNVKITRMLMEESKTLPFENDELWGFTRLTPKLTDLNCDIFVDDDKTYENYNHDLWLYADFNGFKIPITINEEPVIKKFVEPGKYKLNEVCRFITNNILFLTNYANGKIDKETFFDVLEMFRKSGTLLENRDYTILSTLSPKDTGLPSRIWVDENSLYLPHAPRIKFRAVKSNKNTNNDPSMEILNTDRIHNLPSKHDLSSKDIKKIKEFVKNNEKGLLDLANHRIDIKEFTKTMKVSTKTQTTFQDVKTFDTVYGITLCELNGKYNYILKNGDYLLPYFVDQASDFLLFDNRVLIAKIIDKGRKYYIDKNGNEITI